MKKFIIFPHSISILANFYIIVFFINIASEILGYAFPIVVEESVKSNTIMGLIMSLSSITGLLIDFIIPPLISDKNWKQLAILGICLALLFPIGIILGINKGLIIFFMIASIIWGIYCEVITFAEQNHINDEHKKSNYSREWGKVSLITSIAIIISPIIGSYFLVSGELKLYVLAIILFLVALCILLLIPVSRKTVEKQDKNDNSLNIWREIKVWTTISPSIWQVLIVTFLIQSIFASWSIFGGLLGKDLIGLKMGWIPMSLFALAGLVASFFLSRFIVQQHKKLLTYFALIMGGLLLMYILPLIGNLVLICVVIFFSSFMFDLAYTLNNAVFSDLAARLDKEQNSLFGMENAMGNVAYIVTPIILGVLSDKFDYYHTFMLMGALSFFIGVILIFTTPRKLRLPQKDLNEIEN